MTNAQIILNAQLELMKQGIIGSTGRQLKLVKEDGTTEIVPEPEPIHTYAIWKKLGYQVSEGQKAIATIQIWKHIDVSTHKDKIPGDEVEEKVFKKAAYFFRRCQVEPITQDYYDKT